MRTIATSDPRSAQGDYLFSNSGREAPTRFAALSELFDDATVLHLKKCGVERGWRCLEIGAGGGSIANWLSRRVGRSGHVLATDIDLRLLQSLKPPNVEVRCHDICADALPRGTFDLAHARLVLLHLPKREEALINMISALKPGGWLVVEEYDSVSMPPDPAVSPGEILLKTQIAMLRFLEDSGVDRRYGRLLFGRLRGHGLTSVGAEARVVMCHSASAGASMLRANLQQLREAMIDGGYITRQQFDEDMVRLDDQRFFTPSSILWSAWGRR
jgi:SAM-dependent methyltransferase